MSALQHIVPYRCPSAGICYVILYVLFDKGHQIITPSELLYVSHCLLKLSAIACTDVPVKTCNMVAFMSASNSSVTHLHVCMSYVLDILQFYTRQEDEVSSSVALVSRDNKGSPDRFLEYPDVVQVALPLAGSISSKAPE